MMLSHNTQHSSKLQKVREKTHLFHGVKRLAWTCILSTVYPVPLSATINTALISLSWMMGDGDERSRSYLSFGILIPKQPIH